MFFRKFFQKNTATNDLTVTVLSRSQISKIIANLPKESCVISINTPGEEHLPFLVPTLYLDFTDSEDKDGMTMIDANKVADFIKHNMENGHYCLYVHCDQGVSRSAGTAAAILRAYGKDEGQILDSSDYCINARCYEFVLNAFGIEVSEDDVLDAQQRSKCAYLKGWPTY